MHTAVFNSAWVHTHEAIEADLVGDPERGRRHYHRAAALFDAAALLQRPRDASDRASESVDLAAAARVLTGIPPAGTRCCGV